MDGDGILSFFLFGISLFKGAIGFLFKGVSSVRVLKRDSGIAALGEATSLGDLAVSFLGMSSLTGADVSCDSGFVTGALIGESG